jgi:hypothetical protein
MLIIKNGNFYKDGNLIPTEFGNKEQIEALRLYQNRLQKIENEEVSINVSFERREITASYSFQCACGNKVYGDEIVDDDEESELVGKTARCKHCLTKYVFSETDDFELTIKIINK